MSGFTRLAGVTAVLLASTSAYAQTAPRPERPYRGLFGSGASDWDQSLVASLDFGAGYDGDLLAQATGQETSGALRPRSGAFAGAGAGLSYQLSRNVYTFSARYGSSARYYPNLSESLYTSHSFSESFGASYALSPRTTLSFGQEATYQPYTAMPVLDPTIAPPFDPTVSPAPDLDLTLSSSYLTVGGNAGISYQLNSRVKVAAGYSHRWRRNDEIVGYLDRAIDGTVTVGIHKGVSGYVGYSIGDVEYRAGDVRHRYKTQGMNFGVNFDKAISLSRRTKMTFGTGVTGVATNNSRTYYALTGHVGLTHELGRTWTTGLHVGRDVRFETLLAEPAVADQVSGFLSGLLSRRISFTSTVSAGTSRVDRGSRRAATRYAASAGITYAINQFVGLSADYIYYNHAFAPSVVLPTSVRRREHRHGARVFVTVWAPIFHRSREAAR